jgi:hypothetical protein
MTNKTAGFIPEELAERQKYVDWIVWWYEWISQDRNLNGAELHHLLSHLPTIELAKLSISTRLNTFSSYIRWGLENIEAASPEQREAVIDAIVRQDTTGLYGGSELPTGSDRGRLSQRGPSILGARPSRASKPHVAGGTRDRMSQNAGRGNRKGHAAQ